MLFYDLLSTNMNILVYKYKIKVFSFSISPMMTIIGFQKIFFIVGQSRSFSYSLFSSTVKSSSA